MNDVEALARAAHRLKGTVFYLASKPVLNCLRMVEQRARERAIRKAAIAAGDLEDRILALKEALAEHRNVPVKP